MTVKSLAFNKISVLEILKIFGFAVLTALCAVKIPLPFTPVPVTLQSLAVVLAGAYLGPWKGAASQITLILMGSFGFPVFSDRTAGLVTLLGPTGGYILGFVFAAFMAGWLFERLPRKNFFFVYGALLLASMFIFLPGVSWLKVWMHYSWAQSFAAGFLPFLLGDLVKTFVATGMLLGTRKFSGR